MPVISFFYGIKILMFMSDHAPPHFHAWYGEHRIEIQIVSGKVLGQFPPNQLKKIQKWRKLHVEELLKNWDLTCKNKQPIHIEPLI